VIGSFARADDIGDQGEGSAGALARHGDAVGVAVTHWAPWRAHL
jgi:hypothetical protein